MSAPPASPRRRNLDRKLKGLEEARQRRHLEAVARVDAYRKWLANGSPILEIPAVPSDADFRNWKNHSG